MFTKVSNDEIKSRFPALDGLSVTKYFDDQYSEIYMNQGNWELPPKNFTGNHVTYLQYLVQHEIGHALGYSHVDPKSNPLYHCPVMYQQSKGTHLCRPNPWSFSPI